MAVQALEMGTKMRYTIVVDTTLAIFPTFCRFPLLRANETEIDAASHAMPFVTPRTFDIILRAAAALMQPDICRFRL